MTYKHSGWHHEAYDETL